MSSQSDQTEYIVLGISLLITALCGYLGYLEYREQQKLQKQLAEDQEALNNQKGEVHSLRTRLENVSSVLGWNSLHVKAPPEKNGSDLNQGGTSNKPQGYPSIEELEEKNTLVQQTREIMKTNGFSKEKIEATTATEPEARAFLEEFYRTNVERTNRSLTDQLAITQYLNHSHYLVPIIDSTPVSAGTLEEHNTSDKKWELSEPSTEKDTPSAIHQGSVASNGTTVTELLDELSRIRNELLSEIESLDSDIEGTRQTFVSYVADRGDEEQIPDYISESEEEVNNLDRQVQNLIKNVREKRDQLVRNQGDSDHKIYQKRRDISHLLDRQTREVIEVQERITELQKRLRDLRSEQKRKTEQARKDTVDGEILSTNQNVGVAFIDIGRSDGMFIGQEFEVFHTIKGGREVKKGEIRVVELFDDYARAKIISQQDSMNNPIEENDFIRSEEFNRGQTKTFVFAGQFSGDYNESVLKQMVLENGHQVNFEVTINTDYLVIGTGYKDQPRYQKAKELNVNTISPENLKHLFNEQ